MPTRTKTITLPDDVQRAAADFAAQVQDAVNIIAISGAFHRHLLALHGSGVRGDELINHPVAIAFTSKLNSLCRISAAREMAAFEAIDRIQQGQPVEYEVIPL